MGDLENGGDSVMQKLQEIARVAMEADERINERLQAADN